MLFYNPKHSSIMRIRLLFPFNRVLRIPFKPNLTSENIMFGLEARDVQCMYNYAAALKRFDEIKPNRAGDRCISSNRSLTIRKDGDDIECAYNNHVCVTYQPDGDIRLSTCGWNTPSTATFIRACTGLSCGSMHGSIYVSLASGYYLLQGRELVIRDGAPVNPFQQTRRVLNRERAAITKAQLRPCLAHIKLILSAITPTQELIGQHQNRTGHASTNELYWAMLYESTWALPVSYCIANCFKVMFVEWSKRGVIPEEWDDYKTQLKSVIAKLYKYAYYQQDCYDGVEVPLGEIPRRST